MTERMQSPAEPGFARAQPRGASRLQAKKEGAHGGTMGSPVLEHDDMNVLCLGSEVVGAELAADLLRAFLRAEFDGGERYVRRLEKIEEMERSHA
jgi:hypothetical protein